MPETAPTPPDPTQRAADTFTAFARAIDGIAARGAARTWFAAILRIAALWYGVPALVALPKDVVWMVQRIIYQLTEDTRDWYYQMEIVKEAWENGGSTVALVITWAVIAWKAPRISAWVFPLMRKCAKCGYTLGRVSKTSPDTACPECGEGKAS
ncbi:MAG: hypothetical protein QM783_18925 [Phycisphaerales bacterium]